MRRLVFGWMIGWMTGGHARVLPSCLLAAVLLPGMVLLCGAGAPAKGSEPEPVAGSPEIVANLKLDGEDPPLKSVVVSQVHNAPGWQPYHRYKPATGPYTRVLNGPGWNADSQSYHPGQPLDAYQLVSPGTCTSAPQGGPRGTGDAIKDGSCVWKYLSRVDYISLTGWAFDAPRWRQGTTYHLNNTVTAGSPLKAYALLDNSCVSSIQPSDSIAGVRSFVARHLHRLANFTLSGGDGCHWQYRADVIYSSGRSFIPAETFTRANGPALLMMKASYEAQLWNDREYVAGRNGEASPIRLQDHDDYRHEGGQVWGCQSCYHLIVTAAPGESFRDTLKPADPLAGYDPSKGVAIRDSAPYKWPFQPAGLDIHDNFVDLIGLQVKSLHGAAVNGFSSFGNSMTIRDCILEGGSFDAWTPHAAVTTDTSSIVANSLVISHGPMGVVLKYPGYVLHTTIVSTDHVPGSVGIETFFRWVFNDTVVSNTAIFGFTHAVAHSEVPTSWSPRSSHNVTDAPVGDSGTGPWADGEKGSSTVDPLPGTTYGASMAQAFVKPGSDWRLSPASPLRGAGDAVGRVAVNCIAKEPACSQRSTYDVDASDIIGTPRPQHGQDDIGAWQSVAQHPDAVAGH